MAETSVLIRQAQAGEKESREVLIEQNLGLVHHIVKRFLGRGYEAEDLFQIGTIGLIIPDRSEKGCYTVLRKVRKQTARRDK